MGPKQLFRKLDASVGHPQRRSVPRRDRGVLFSSSASVLYILSQVKAWRNWAALLAKHHCSHPNSNVR